MNPTISVIILTHNRARMLAQCLEALREQTRFADEIIIINNASTDNTPEVVDEFISAKLTSPIAPLPIRMIDGDSAGAWGARNQGVKAAKSDWIAFTDDDCVPAKDWLQRVEQNIRQGYDAVGGLVEPTRPLSYPWWWHPDMAWTLGLSVPGMGGPFAGSIYYPQTANWAMKRSVAMAEPFHPIEGNYNQSGGQFRAGREDAELWRRLRRGCYYTRVDPKMLVRHQVEEIQQTRLSFRENLRRAWLDGAALQQREPYRQLVLRAVDNIIAFPDNAVFGIWGWKQNPLREAAWKLLWTVRQIGQCSEFVRREGLIKGSALMIAYAARCAFNQGHGRLKRTLRGLGIAAMRLRRRPASKFPARSIVIATSGYLGDMVMLQPFISGLKQQRPEVSITLIANEKGEEIYAHEPAVSRIVLLDNEPESPTAIQELIQDTLEEVRAELILVPYFHNVHPKALYSRPKARVVTFADQVGFPKRWWYDRADMRLPKPIGRPERENLMRLFAEAGFRGPLPDEPLAFAPEEMEEMSNFLRSRNLDRYNLVVLVPGTAKEEKLWVDARWAEVVKYLKTEYELEVALAGAPSEEGLCRRIADLSGFRVHIWCWPGIRRLALALSETRLAVCCDNGPKHLAGAMDTPTLTLYGPTDERQWTPVKNPQRHGAVRACAWDLTEEERIGLSPDHQMKAISTERVLRALDEMLAEW